MTNRKKILLIHTGWSTFVRTDHQILSSRYQVSAYHFRPARGVLGATAQVVKQLLTLMLTLWRYDMLYVWFADMHSFLPVLLAKLAGKRCYLVIGGFDVCRMPALRYGVFCSRPRGFAAAWSMRHSTLNLPVSEHVARKVRAISRRRSYALVYNCVNLEPRAAGGEPPERTQILTVAAIDSERTYYIKGIDRFAATARLLPQHRFTIVGLNPSKLQHLLALHPPNVTVVGGTPHRDLPAHYARARVYCQLSRTESFGVALAEAILQGCTPLVTNVGGMPEVVGDPRYVVSSNPAQIASRIAQFFSEGDSAGSAARRRVEGLFSLENRRAALLNLLAESP